MSRKIKLLKEWKHPTTLGKSTKWLITIDGDYHVLSRIEGMFANEVMLFKADESGKIIDFLDLGTWPVNTPVVNIMKELGH